MTVDKKNFVRSHIWKEDPELDNPFAARVARCYGYDVYGDLLGKAKWGDMLYLLFRGEAPLRWQRDMLDTLAVALANPGPRDPSIHAAMCSGTSGATAASALIAALAVGAGQLLGGREVWSAMRYWDSCGRNLEEWEARIGNRSLDVPGIWEQENHTPGFDPHGVTATLIVKQVLAYLASIAGDTCVGWLDENRERLERLSGCPLSLSGIAAAAYFDLGLTPEEGEMCHLLLRLPGAAVHSLEQRNYGHKNFPFFSLELTRPQAEKSV